MKCNMQPLFRYTWPGNPEKYACLIHAQQLKNVSTAMGFQLQLIPLTEDEALQKSCDQEVRGA